jgi:TctA family transporter
VIGRRRFIARMAAGAVAASLVRHLPGIAGSPAATIAAPHVLELDGWASEAYGLKKGDVITFSARYLINPDPVEGRRFVITGVAESE